MPQPTLILILGPPASGKTTLSRAIAKHLGLPLLVKDDLKEIIFDTLGWTDREWSKKVGRSTFRILDYVVEQQLQAGHSVIVETPLAPEFENAKFQRWQAAYGFHCIQVFCYADHEVLVQRFEKRAGQERHPGHRDDAEDYRKMLAAATHEPLAIDGEVIKVDTTDFATVDQSAIIDRIKRDLSR